MPPKPVIKRDLMKTKIEANDMLLLSGIQIDPKQLKRRSLKRTKREALEE